MNPETPQEVMRQIAAGYQLSQMVYVAAELGLADRMKDGPVRTADLANTTGAHPDRLGRLLRGLAAAGIFTRLDGDRYALNPLAETLLHDSPGSLRARVIFTISQHYPAWSQLLHCVKTGETGFERQFGMSAWEYRAQNDAARKVFDAATRPRGDAIARAVVAAFDWEPFGLVVDVGGGQGALIAAVLQAYPATRGVLFDLPGAVEAGLERLRSMGLDSRCQVVAGSFMEEVPAGGDAYILSRVLHDWDDREAARILENCRRASAAGARLLIVERVLDPADPTLESVLADMSMMVVDGGRERTLTEFQDLLVRTGYEFTGVEPAGALSQMITATAV
ncbi:MAG: acetylserotonin O-methyltransferase [Chloroflexi bacterium]|nr:acetylserotonin O-methyltransferase [Chloroflexota bacterium]